jgi:hypothetical protein
MEGLTNLLVQQGNESKAESLTRDALNVRQEKLSDFDPCIISNLRGLAGVIYEKQNRDLAEAEKLQKRAAEEMVHSLGERNPDNIDAMAFLAKIVARRGDLAENVIERDALQKSRQNPGTDHPKSLYVSDCLMTTLRKQGKSQRGRSTGKGGQ